MSEMNTVQWWRAALDGMLARLPTADGKRYAVALEHGTLEVGVYAPRGEDPQEPHKQDEIYVVMHGQGTFVHGEVREKFDSGDMLFVPAGVVHRFEDFSDDLAIWVMFYGPEGGEEP